MGLFMEPEPGDTGSGAWRLRRRPSRAQLRTFCTQLAPSQIGSAVAVKYVSFFSHCCLRQELGRSLEQGSCNSLCAKTCHVSWCRRTLLMAGVSLCMSAVWLSAVADEVVALLQALGHILGITTVRPALPTQRAFLRFCTAGQHHPDCRDASDSCGYLSLSLELYGQGFAMLPSQ